VEAVQSRGGVLELGDLSSHATARVDPICTTYRWAVAVVSGRATCSVAIPLWLHVLPPG
jgi:gamma-glutamyltranspeptidase